MKCLVVRQSNKGMNKVLFSINNSLIHTHSKQLKVIKVGNAVVFFELAWCPFQMTCRVVCTGESQITSVYSSALTHGERRMFASVNGKRDLVPVNNRSRLQEQSLQSAYKADGWELISVVQTVITIRTEFIAYSFYKKHSPMYFFAFYYFTTLNHVFFIWLF